MSSLIGQHLGQYEIVALLGKGGMATVYRAQQTSMGRDVAIKVIKPDLAESGDFVTRFEREARTVASLSHPHILKVFDYGHHGELVYLVMELLKGGSLADLIRTGALTPQAAGRILDQIASALDYAHEQGIIHRDLKPQNVLLDGKANALLTDFGIAKLLSQNTILTQSGTAMGTPAYMSPEQWQGKPIDARSDIYSLGVMLFEMLAGRLPFQAETPYSMMHMHVSVPPPPINDIRDDLPPGMTQVIAKALAKDRDERYSTAGEVSADFKAVLGGQPISALNTTNPLPTADIGAPEQANLPRTAIRTPGQGTAVPTQGKATKAPQQTPAIPSPVQPRRSNTLMIGIIAVLIVALLAVAGVTIIALLGASKTPTPVAAAPTNIVTLPPLSTQTLEKILTFTSLPGPSATAALTLRAEGSPTTVEQSATLTFVPPTPSPSTAALASSTHTPTPDLQQTVGAMIASTQTALATMSLKTTTPTAESPTATPTLATEVALNSAPPTISVENASEVTVLAVLQGAHAAGVNSVAFSRDGSLIASGGDDGAIWLWDVRTGKQKASLNGHDGRVLSVAFSADGTFLASAGNDTTIRLWNAGSGTYHSTLRGPTLVPTSLAFSPDSTTLAAGFQEGTIVLWNLTSGKPTFTMKGDPGTVYAVAFSPDGTKVASAGEDQIVRLWDVSTGNLLSLLYGHSSNIQALAFSPDGALLASGGLDNTIQLWDATNGEFHSIWHSDDDNILGLAFSPDSAILAAASGNKVRLWNVETGETIIALEGHQDNVLSVAFSPDGTEIASGSADNTVRLWGIKS